MRLRRDFVCLVSCFLRISVVCQALSYAVPAPASACSSCRARFSFFPVPARRRLSTLFAARCRHIVLLSHIALGLHRSARCWFCVNHTSSGMATLKLRVRAASGGPTIRVQVPLLCSLQGLKDVLVPLISLPSSSFLLSLNKKDAINGPGSALLSAFGVTNGDLLFYLVDTGSASRSPFVESATTKQGGAANHDSAAAGEFSPQVGTVSALTGSEPSSHSQRLDAKPATSSNMRELCASAAAGRAASSQMVQGPTEKSIAESDSLCAVISSDFTGRTEQIDDASVMEGLTSDEPMDGKGAVQGEEHSWVRRLLIPDLLQRVLSSELGNVRQASSCLVLAVHAVMLETGFVSVDSLGSRPALGGHMLPSGWSDARLVNLIYTLPELVSDNSGNGEAPMEEALLRCQTVGNSLVVYGAVSSGSVHRLSLSVSKFLHENFKILPVTEESCEVDDSGTDTIDVESVKASGNRNMNPVLREAPVTFRVETEEVFHNIYELWKEVKDSVSLPLLTVMCEKAGLPPPPSLFRLPTELKVKVLDSLPAVALANVACVSSELRFLAASEDLWKQQYRLEFGACGKRAPGGRGWKSAFVREWEYRKRREEERRQAERYFQSDMFPPGTILRAPSFAPHFGGLDYYHGIGGGSRGGYGGFGLDGGSGFRNFGLHNGPSGNPSNRAVGRLDFVFGNYREDVPCYHGVDFEGHGSRAWLTQNSFASRGMRSIGRRDVGSFAGRGVDISRRVDGEGSTSLFLGLGPFNQ